MNIEKDNEGLAGWYDGFIKKDTSGGYQLHQIDEYAAVPDEAFAEEIWNDVHDTGLEVMFKGILHVQELLTGSQRFELGQVDRAGILLEENYAGRKVGVSDYDLVFFDGDEEQVYSHDTVEGLKSSMEGWFDEEQVDEYMEELEPVLKADNWPWTV